MESGAESRETESFADCLKQQMRRADRLGHTCSPKCLAKALGHKDPSYVRSWLRGGQPPHIDSRRIDVIREHLMLDVQEVDALKRAQEWSLWNWQPPTATEFPVEILLGQQPNTPSQGTKRRADNRPRGADIVDNMIALLEQAPMGTGKEEESNTITLTWQGRDSIEMSEPQQTRWTAALQVVLRRGWHVHHLCRLDENVNRTVHLVEMMLDFFGSGAYAPYYFMDYGTLSAPYDLLAIPGYAALWLFSAHSSDRVDSGVVTLDPEQISDAVAHARQLWALTKPLVRAYFRTEKDEAVNARYLESLYQGESYPGGRIAVIDALTAITQPEEWFELALPSKYTAFPEFDAWRTRSRGHSTSIAHFKRHRERYEYFDLITERAINEIVANGTYSSRRGELFHMPKALRLDHLRNVVALLRMDNYHLALVTEDQRTASGQNGIHIGAAWVVTGDNSAFLELAIPGRDGGMEPASVHITESTVTDAFRKLFRQMWNRIPPVNRENASVIRYLETKIADLERAIAEPDE